MMTTCLQIFIYITFVMVKFTNMFTIQTKQMPKVGQLADQVDVTGYTTRKIYPGFRRSEDTTLRICGIDSFEDDYYGCVELEKPGIPRNDAKIKLKQKLAPTLQQKNRFTREKIYFGHFQDRQKLVKIIPMRNTLRQQINSLSGLKNKNIMTVGIPTKKYRMERKKIVILNKVRDRKPALRLGIETENLNTMNDTNDFTQTKLETTTTVPITTLKTTTNMTTKLLNTTKHLLNNTKSQYSETSVSHLILPTTTPPLAKLVRENKNKTQPSNVTTTSTPSTPCQMCFVKTFTFGNPVKFDEATLSTVMIWYNNKPAKEQKLAEDGTWLGKPERDWWPTMSTSPPRTTMSTWAPFR